MPPAASRIPPFPLRSIGNVSLHFAGLGCCLGVEYAMRDDIEHVIALPDVLAAFFPT
jgi:hypothetical protein